VAVSFISGVNHSTRTKDLSVWYLMTKIILIMYISEGIADNISMSDKLVKCFLFLVHYVIKFVSHTDRQTQINDTTDFGGVHIDLIIDIMHR
jgi:hypothetical protein